MTLLTLTPKPAASGRIDLAGLAASLATARSIGDLSELVVGTTSDPARLGDVFTVSGDMGRDMGWHMGWHMALHTGSLMVDNLGARLTGGTLTVTGNVGNFAGRGMKAGTIEVIGNAGDYLGSGMKGGLIHVTGNAGNFVGAVGPGKRFGMTGGNVVVEGNVGARAGDKMRRGLILVRGQTAEAAGSRMVGGTIIAESGFGAGPGPLLRRGTLIGPKAGEMLSTFADCGVHELVILSLMARGWSKELGPLAPRQLPQKVRRFAGDLAAIGKGELLLTTF